MQRKTKAIIVIVAITIVAVGYILSSGPKYIEDEVKANPEGASAGKWLLFSGELYKWTMRAEEYHQSMKLYLKLFNPDKHEEYDHYYDQEEYIWSLFWEAEAWEDMPGDRGPGSKYRAKYQRAIDKALEVEDIDEDHLAIIEMKKRIRKFW